MNILATIGLYLMFFILLFIAVGIIYSVISFIVRLFRAEEKAVKQTKRIIWLISFSIFVFCLCFIQIMFKLDDKQKGNEAYLTQPLHETYSNQE